MQQKRSKGITILAWLAITLNALILITSFDTGHIFECYQAFPRNFIIGIITYSILSSTIGIFVGRGLLRLIDKFRKIGLVINSLDLLIGMVLFPLSLPHFKTYSYSFASYIIAETSSRLSVTTFYMIILGTMVISSLAFFIFNILFIFFFSRPKVKEQFK